MAQTRSYLARVLFALILTSFFGVRMVNAQVLFFEDFNSGEMPENLILLDLDGLQPSSNEFGPSWTIYKGRYDTYEAASTSNFRTSGSVNDWMILPQFDIPVDTETSLYFRVHKLTGSAKAHYFRVKISSSDSEPASFVDEVHVENLTDDATRFRKIDLSEYAGSKIYIALIHDQTKDDYHLFLDDIAVVAENVEYADVSLDVIRFSDNYMRPGQHSVFYQITNRSAVPLTSFTIHWSDGDQNSGDRVIQVYESFLGSYRGEISDFGTWSSPGVYDVKVWITFPNSLDDAKPEDNIIEQKQTIVTNSGQKRVLIEEYTGTWCGWCPRGAIILRELIHEMEGNVCGIAYHNGDDMAYTNGLDFINWIYATSYPTGSIDRARLNWSDEVVCYSTNYWGPLAKNRLGSVTPVDINGTINYNSSRRMVEIDIVTNFRSDDYGLFRTNAVITENGITGYPQNNYYNNRTDYAELRGAGDPIVDYQHNHAARYSAGGSLGVEIANGFVQSGSELTNNFEFRLPSSVNPENAHVVLMIFKDGGSYAERQIMNVIEYPLLSTSSMDEITLDSSIRVYPNPVHGILHIEGLDIEEITICDLTGAICHQSQYQDNKTNRNLDTSTLESGIFVVKLKLIDGQVIVRKIIVE